ncbi:hypothetical protein KYY02_19545 [Streptomyces pimonensis]|uniref:Uncharacterized protein n=1 Tax=Streptomyces pimonensis TaxID=2860288 RepID=A0ABV4J4Q9_9ACTN
MTGTDAHFHDETDPVLIDPAACNALTQTAAGLRAPRTALQALASTAPAPVGAARSVNVDLVHPGGCPDVWQIGARLSPVSGEAVLTTAANLLPSPGAWVNTALVVTLPEPGRYFLAWDVRAQICAQINYCTNAWAEAAIFDNATGGVEAGARTIVQHQFSKANDGAVLQTCQSGSIPITHITGVTAAQGSRTLRLRGLFQNSTTCPNTRFQSATMVASRNYVTWYKITD